MSALLKFDFLYLKKTKKLIIFPVIFIVFASISVLTERFMNELLAEFMSEDGVIFQFPDPTMLSSYSTYVKDLFEITLFITIFVSISYFISDKTKGIYPLILSKPIRPAHYILSKYITFNTLIIFSVIIGHGFFLYYTYNLFGEIDIRTSLISVSLFITYLLFITSVACLSSIIMKQYLGAIIVTFITYLGLSLISTFRRFDITQMLPGSIVGNIQNYIVNNETQFIIPCVTITIVISIVLIALAIIELEQNDLTG